MLRPRYTWLAFALCLAVVVAAMGWMSLTMLDFERAQTRTARQSESERLALWRMDSAVVPLIARESSRPHAQYSAFYHAEHAYSKWLQVIDKGDVLIPSALLAFESPYVRLHFQIDPRGRISSPQAPSGNERDLAEAKNYTTHERILAAAARLDELRKTISRDVLMPYVSDERALPLFDGPAAGGHPEAHPSGSPAGRERAQQDFFPNAPGGSQLLGPYAQQMADEQADRSLHELQQRFRNTTRNQAPIADSPARPDRIDGHDASPAGTSLRSGRLAPSVVDAQSAAPQPPRNTAVRIEQGPMRPVWVGETLLLVRKTIVDGHLWLEGCVLNWPAIREWLTGEARDLLPEADLVPVREAAGRPGPLMLASLPLRLVPGRAVVDPPAALSPMRMSLATAWLCLVLAAAAVAALLWAAVRLSERRGAFVSAVTHELRTPLTTFRMYAEMLAGGMVRDETRRQEYLQTLQSESERLGHLVENVLSYARLENSRGRAIETVSLTELIERVSPQLRRIAERAGMSLSVETDATDVTVRADAGAVERILVNLVDNAGKYAGGCEDRRIHVECERAGSSGIVRVRDHGAGITRGEARRLFRPFSKSDRQAAESAPGIGLGLVLCRRLARSMGGELTIDHRVADGACFVLRLPGW